MAKYLNKNGVQYLWQKMLGRFAHASHTHSISDVTELQTRLSELEARLDKLEGVAGAGLVM